MTTLAVAASPPRVRSKIVYQIALAFVGSWLVAGLAQFSIKLPFTPVPVTGQTLGVLLVGASLGPVVGALSMGLYLAQGGLGLPFFAKGAHGWELLRLASATGGYLWGFVVAAGAVGLLARSGWDRSLRSAISAMFIGEVVLFAIGVPWLMAAIHVPLEKGLEFGLYPFVIGDTLKLLIAAGLLPVAWRLVGRGDEAG